MAILLVIGWGAFFLLRGMALEGGDTALYHTRDWEAVHLNDYKLVWNIRAAFSNMLLQLVHRQVRDVTLSFQIYSAFFGGLYLATLYLCSLRPRFWVVMLCSAGTLLFCGHEEFYAPAIVALSFFLLALTRTVQQRPGWRPWHVLGAFGLAVLFHRGNLIYLPCLFWLWLEARERRLMRTHWSERDWLLAIGLGLIFVLSDMIPSLLNLADRKLVLVIGLHDPLRELITPPTRALADQIASTSIGGAWFWFTLGAPLHWKFMAYAFAIGAPLALPVLWLHGRRLMEAGTPAAALATAVACGLGWAFLWHPHMLWKDWDLFMIGVLPLNFTAAMLAANELAEPDEVSTGREIDTSVGGLIKP